MLRSFLIGLFDRATSLAVGVAVTFLFQTLHVIIDPSSEAGLKVLLLAVATAVYDLGARYLAKKLGARFPWLPGLLGVTV